MDVTERREHVRQRVSRVDVKVASRESLRASYLRDLSWGGLFVRSRQPLPTGTPVVVDLTVAELLPVRLRGEVVRHDRLSSRNEIYTMSANGSGVTRLTNVAGNNVTPAFSPDGSRITFISSRDGGQRNVWIMNSDGTNQVKLTTNQGFSHTANNPVFNHDGTRIAFDSDRGTVGNANHDIFSIAPDGSAELRLTTALGKDTHPSYSRDGSRVVFISFRDGGARFGEIYTMNADGSDQQRVTDTPFAEIEPHGGGQQTERGDRSPMCGHHRRWGHDGRYGL